MSRLSEILSSYSFNPAKPRMRLNNLQIFDAVHKQSNVAYTIKTLRNADSRLEDYLRKMKETVSDYVIRIYEYGLEVAQGKIVIVQEHCEFGTLEKALKKPGRLEQQDSIYVGKMILNGHIDLLRNNVTWFGTQADIQFTENGLKLSWNNSAKFSDKTPMPEILKRISARDAGLSSILPFPPSKMMADLIAVSAENASEISLHPIMKKKEKLFKKKGKNWVAFKQNKIRGEYFQELAYLAVSAEYGMVRVKAMDEGSINEELMKIYQTNACFVKVLDYYTQKGQFYVVSEYANDGTVQNYVKRLKTSNVGLKQNQIEFFFFSMIQPLKFIHQSAVRSYNLLNIRNIYIENGIPKIGEPVPLNQKFEQTLIDRADVPDFYHSQFKRNPRTSNPIYDTYSLGVLLYKLMYTEYPIFPEGKVHVPTTPSYKKNLKAAIELFLNVGGNLFELEQQLEISEDVKIEVKNNQKFLELANKKNMPQIVQERDSEKAKSEHGLPAQIEAPEAGDSSWLRRLWRWLTKRTRDTSGKYQTIYNSEYDAYRQCTTVFVVVLLYFFAFFLLFMNGTVNLFNYTRLFTPFSISILGQTYKIITPSFDSFIAAYQNISQVSPNTLNETLLCRIDNRLRYYDFVRSESPHWNLYLALGIVVMIIMLVVKAVQLCKYSTVRAGYHYYDTTISGVSQSRFALSSYVLFQMWFALGLWGFYQCWNYVFNEQHLPCFGGQHWTRLTETLMLDRPNFCVKYLIALCVVWFLGLVSFAQVLNHHRIQYSLLVNPIFVYAPFYLALTIALRVGVYQQFVPSFVNNQQGIIGSSYMDVVGYFPELLVLAEVLACLLIDQIFYRRVFGMLDKFVVENSVALNSLESQGLINRQ